MTVHRTHPPTRAMRDNPDIDQLKRQARELLEAYRTHSPDAIIEVAAHHRTATPETFALHDAQFVLARSYGFESWPKLKAAVDGVTTTRLHEAVQKGDLGAVRALLARRPEIVDLLREGPSGFEIRAIHIAVMARDVEMTRLLLEAGADTRDGIWPNRDATSPRTIAEERGYDEIVALMTAHEEKRGARVVNAHDDGVRRLRDAMTGGEEAVIAVFESEPGLAGMCPPDGVTMLHRAAQYGLLRVAKWLLDHGADVNKQSQPDFWRWKGRTPLEFAVWEYAADSGRAAREAMAALVNGGYLYRQVLYLSTTSWVDTDHRKQNLLMCMVSLILVLGARQIERSTGRRRARSVSTVGGLFLRRTSAPLWRGRPDLMPVPQKRQILESADAVYSACKHKLCPQLFF